MRLSVIALGLVTSQFVLACDKNEANNDESTEQATENSDPASAQHSAQVDPTAAATASLEAKMGGNLVTLGKNVIELRVHRKGLIEARVSDTAGAAIASDSVKKLIVTAGAKGGTRAPVELKWDAPHACFRGEADAKGELAAEPLDIELTVGDQTAKASLSEYALLAEPKFGGQIVSAGRYSAEILATVDGAVRALIQDSAGANLDAGANVTLALPTASRKAQAVSLEFVPTEAAFSGKAATGVELTPGPMTLTVKTDGKTNIGALAKVVLESRAEHGGQIVTAGDYSLEIVPNDTGIILAYAFDASGKALATGDLDVELAFGADTSQKVDLEWDGAKACYSGKLSGTFDPAMKPLRVSIRAEGRAHTGALAAFGAKANLAATGRAHADVNAKTDLSAKVAPVKAKAGANQVVAAKAVANVKPPKVEMKKSAKASASTNNKSGASASGKAKAGISFGLK